MYSDNWIQELAKLEQNQQPCVIVTVLETTGSVPRNAGTKMLITEDRLIAACGRQCIDERLQLSFLGKLQ